MLPQQRVRSMGCTISVPAQRAPSFTCVVSILHPISHPTPLPSAAAVATDGDASQCPWNCTKVSLGLHHSVNGTAPRCLFTTKGLACLLWDDASMRLQQVSLGLHHSVNGTAARGLVTTNGLGMSLVVSVYGGHFQVKIWTRWGERRQTTAS